MAPELDVREVPPRSAKAKRCRVCGRPLHGTTEKTLGRHEDCPSDMDAAVFEGLRAWRSALSQEMQVPAYIVFTDATLVAIAEAMPATERELLSISGVGPVKVERFGESLLAALSQYR